jgi:hypothetical protein
MRNNKCFSFIIPWDSFKVTLFQPIYGSHIWFDSSIPDPQAEWYMVLRTKMRTPYGRRGYNVCDIKSPIF